MSVTPSVQPRLRLGTGHVISAEEHKEWTRLRKAAHRNGRKFSKDDYIELLQTEDMDSLRQNHRVDWQLIPRKFPGMPSVIPSTGSARSSGSSSNSTPSTSAENSPADASRESRFEFPGADENQPTSPELAPISSGLRKRLGQLSTLSAFNDLRSAYTEDDQRRQKQRRNSDPDDEAMPVLLVNARVPPPPQLLRLDGNEAMGFAADEHDHLAQLADAMFPAGLEEDDEEDDEPPPLDNNAPQPSKFARTGKVPLAMRDSTKVQVQYCGRMSDKCTNAVLGCFGKYKNFVYTIEYQKRGLPHVHMLITLDDRSKLKTADDIDKVISAEIPDQRKNPLLYDLVKSNMVHGPCDQATFPCLDAKGFCSKKFPKTFLDQTRLEEDGYPLYRRPQNGRELLYGSAENPRRADNRWVVPYCPALLKKYNCHMNVEIVQGIRAVKYLYKYIFKGFDRAYMEIAPTDNVLEWDEVSQHLDARYVSSSEACARLLMKVLHGRTHSVIRLHVHKQGQAPSAEEVAEADDPVVGNPENDEEAVGPAYDNLIQMDDDERQGDANVAAMLPVIGNQDAPPLSEDEEDQQAGPSGANPPNESGSNRNVAPTSKSTLNAWLAYNRANDDGRHLTYVEFPSYFRFDKNGNKWIKRKQDAKVIGRMFNISPRDQEAYNLRLLLFYVKGARNFEDIRTVTENGVDTVYPTYTAAALARGLIEDDAEHIKTMEEAVTFAIGHRLRRFFVMILVHCKVKDYKAFWERFKDELSADYMHRLNNETRAVALAYADILELLAQNGKNRERDFPELPVPTIVHDPDVFNPEDERDFFEELERTLNEDQQRVVQFVKEYLDRGCRGNNCIYVGGLGGCGSHSQ